MSTPFPPLFRSVSLPEDATLRRALLLLGILGLAECGILLWYKTPGARFSGSAPADSGGPVPPLMVQPRLDVPTVRAPWQQMLEQSRAAAARGQTAEALRALADAEPQFPQFPFAIAELAAQFEKLGATDRAMKLWERVYQYGAAAGVYFSAAEAKLRLLGEQSAAEAAALPGAAAPKPRPGTAPVQPAAPVRFGKISLRDTPDTSTARRHFVLSVPIHKTAPKPLDPKDIFIEVQFYDQLGGKTLERTNGLIQWKWVTNAMNWTDNAGPNVLEVEYHQGPPRKTGERRAYFGYVASVYYEDKLVDFRADPPRLGQQYPPPRLLPKEVTP